MTQRIRKFGKTDGVPCNDDAPPPPRGWPFDDAPAAAPAARSRAKRPRDAGDAVDGAVDGAVDDAGALPQRLPKDARYDALLRRLKSTERKPQKALREALEEEEATHRRVARMVSLTFDRDFSFAKRVPVPRIPCMLGRSDHHPAFRAIYYKYAHLPPTERLAAIRREVFDGELGVLFLSQVYGCPVRRGRGYEEMRLLWTIDACISDDEMSFQSMVLRPLALSIRWKRDGRRGVSESPSMMGRVDGVEGAGRRHAVAGRDPRDSFFAHAGYIVEEKEVERYYSVLGRVDTPPSHARRGRRDASTPPRESRRALRELRQSADGFVPRRRSATSSSRRRCSTARTTR